MCVWQYNHIINRAVQLVFLDGVKPQITENRNDLNQIVQGIIELLYLIYFAVTFNYLYLKNDIYCDLSVRHNNHLDAKTENIDSDMSISSTIILSHKISSTSLSNERNEEGENKTFSNIIGRDSDVIVPRSASWDIDLL